MTKRAAASFLMLALAPLWAWAEPTPVAPPPPVATQAPASPAQAQDGTAAFVDWAQRLMGSLERAGQAMMPLLRNNDDYSAMSPQEALAALRRLAQQAAQARSQIAVVRDELAAVAPFTHSGATPQQLEMAATLLRDSRTTIANFEVFLGDMIDYVAAIERGDEAAMNRLGPRIERSAVLLVQSQAMMLRGRMPMLPSTSSAYHTVAGMAYMYDGMAALLPDDADFRVADVEAAAAGMDSALIAQRAATFLERASLNRADPNYGVYMQLIEHRERSAGVSERARDRLRMAVSEARAGRSNETNRLNHIQFLGELEYEYQAIARAQLQLQDGLSR